MAKGLQGPPDAGQHDGSLDGLDELARAEVPIPVVHPRAIPFQIHLDCQDAWEPLQGPPHPVGSEAAEHPPDFEEGSPDPSPRIHQTAPEEPCGRCNAEVVEPQPGHSTSPPHASTGAYSFKWYGTLTTTVLGRKRKAALIHKPV